MENLLLSFKLFSGTHLIYLLLTIAISLILILFLKRFEEKLQKIIGWIFIGLMSLFIVLDFLGQLMSGRDIFDSLPLNIHHIFVYICIFVQVAKYENWIKFGYFVALPLLFISLFIVPNYVLEMGGVSIATISYFLLIALICSYCILQLIWSEVYLTKKDIFNCYANYLIIASFVHILNVIFRFTAIAVHSNYFGSMGDQYDVLNEFLYSLIKIPLVHQIPFFLILLGLEFLLMLPFDLIRTKKDRKDQMEELVALGNLKAQQNHRKNGRALRSQILVNSEHKAKPLIEKNIQQQKSSGFVSVTKEVKVNKDQIDK